jgi:hypothetical protein
MLTVEAGSEDVRATGLDVDPTSGDANVRVNVETPARTARHAGHEDCGTDERLSARRAFF